MDYKEKYEQALEKASKLRVQNPFDTVGQMVEHIFPELQESEDEKARKELIAFLEESLYLGCPDETWDSKGIERWIAWLEKQGEKTTDKIEPNPAWSEEDEEILKWLCRIIHSQRLSKEITLKEESELGEWMDKWLNHNPQTKQDEKKHIFNADDWYVSEVDGKIHNVTYNPDNEVESKFKVKDWVILDGTVAQILDKQKYGFIGLDINGKDFFCNYGHTDLMRLWTIADAKDGDVLVTPPEKGLESNEQIFIFKAINSRDYVDDCIEYYGGLCDGVFYKNKTGYMGTTLDTFYPATKEQCDLLFQKMKEAGYEWDDNKKELKKMESKKLDADKVIEWLKLTINERAENYGVYKETRLILPYNSIEDLINDFKEDFGLC